MLVLLCNAQLKFKFQYRRSLYFTGASYVMGLSTLRSASKDQRDLVSKRNKMNNVTLLFLDSPVDHTLEQQRMFLLMCDDHMLFKFQ